MKTIIIMGAAGRDFHNFNVCYRNNPEYKVVAFTASQIPGIENRTYPASLAGELYPKGIPILDEGELRELVKRENIDQVIFAYSDISYQQLMKKAALAIGCGADFLFLGPKSTMITVKVPVIAVTATRTGCGKSQTSRYIGQLLQKEGYKVAVVRHPMPYGDLARQEVQRFISYRDLEAQQCTIEEREEYEPHIEAGLTVYAGIDYEKIAEQAAKEADIIIWDGGNNDLPFFKADINIVVIDALRSWEEQLYYPGESNLYRMDICVINKVNLVNELKISELIENVKSYQPEVEIVLGESRLEIADSEIIRGKDVLVVEDGPTLTHGGMTFGAGMKAAKESGAARLVDPKPYAYDSIKDTFDKYPHLTGLLPAMGYGTKQISDLQETINAVPAEVVVAGTPVDISRLMVLNKPVVKVKYRLLEREARLDSLLRKTLMGLI